MSDEEEKLFSLIDLAFRLMKMSTKVHEIDDYSDAATFAHNEIESYFCLFKGPEPNLAVSNNSIHVGFGAPDILHLPTTYFQSKLKIGLELESLDEKSIFNVTDLFFSGELRQQLLKIDKQYYDFLLSVSNGAFTNLASLLYLSTFSHRFILCPNGIIHSFEGNIRTRLNMTVEQYESIIPNMINVETFQKLIIAKVKSFIKMQSVYDLTVLSEQNLAGRLGWDAKLRNFPFGHFQLSRKYVI